MAGNDVFFAATGVTDGELLQGVRYPGGGKASTESLVMRSRSGTVRTVQARHDQAKLREVTGGRYRLVTAAVRRRAAGRRATRACRDGRFRGARSGAR